MAIGRIANIYLDAAKWGGTNPLVDSRGIAAVKPQFVVGDVFEIRLRWLTLPSSVNGTPTVEQLPGSWALVFAIKRNRSDETLLASASSFSLVTGSGDTYYSATLSLDTDPSIDVGADPDDVWCDVELSNSDNTERLTWQFEAVLNPQVYSSETSPTPAEPTYPAPGAIPVRCVGSVAIGSSDTSVAVTLDGSRDVIPVCVVRKPSASSDDVFVLTTHSVSADGFTVELSAAPGAGGYYVDYIAF